MKLPNSSSTSVVNSAHASVNDQASTIDHLTFSSDDPLLFISDLHLESSRPDITATFLHLLSAITQHQAHPMITPDSGSPPTIKALIILGDFFEVWIGDDYQTQLSQMVATALSRLAQQGTALYFLAGNRDFLLGDRYAEQANMVRLADTTLLTIHDHHRGYDHNRGHDQDRDEPSTQPCAVNSYALMHGDTLCTLDHAYMSFRSMVRDPQWQQQFLSQSIEERLALARAIRDKSIEQKRAQADHLDGDHTHQSIATPIMDVNPQSVAELFSQLPIQTLIHGHTHRPAIHDHPTQGNKVGQRRVVLGDWDQQGWGLLLHNHQLQLRAFPLIKAC